MPASLDAQQSVWRLCKCNYRNSRSHLTAGGVCLRHIPPSVLDDLPLPAAFFSLDPSTWSVLAAQWGSAVTKHHGNVVGVPGIWAGPGALANVLVGKSPPDQIKCPSPPGSRVHAEMQPGGDQGAECRRFPVRWGKLSPLLASASYDKERTRLKSNNAYSQQFCLMKGWCRHWVSKTPVCVLVPVAQDSYSVRALSRSVRTLSQFSLWNCLGTLSHPKTLPELDAEPRQPPLPWTLRQPTVLFLPPGAF